MNDAPTASQVLTNGPMEPLFTLHEKASFCALDANFARMETVVSGIRPTGMLHIGNYFGAVRNFIQLQESYPCFFFIADFHSLTTHPTPGDLHGSVKRVLAEYLAAGLDPEKSTLYLQSDVPEVTELYLYLNMNAYLGELERVSSFKEKARSQPDNINAGLLTYPVLMAADILLHKGTRVPVGKDQEQHLEMARTFGNRFNRLYQAEIFPEPQAFSETKELVKVPGLTGAGKMSKSAGEADCIYLAEPADSLNKKIMRAKTDSGPATPGEQPSQAVQNLFDLMHLVCSSEVCAHYRETYDLGTIRYGDMKKQLAEDMERFIAPWREKISGILADDALLARTALLGAEKARASAAATLNEVRNLIGFRKFY